MNGCHSISFVSFVGVVLNGLVYVAFIGSYFDIIAGENPFNDLLQVFQVVCFFTHLKPPTLLVGLNVP